MTIDLATARMHLKADDDAETNALVTRYLSGSQKVCESFCNRRFYETQEQSDTDYLAALTDLETAENARFAAIEAATTNGTVAAIRDRYIQIIGNIKQRINGIVIDEDIEAAILFTLGHLYNNRQEVVVGTGASAVHVPVTAQRILESKLWIGDLADDEGGS